MNLKGMNNQVQKIAEKVKKFTVYAAKIAALIIVLVLNLAALALAWIVWPVWVLLSMVAPSMTAGVLQWSFDRDWFIPILGIYRGYRWMPYYVKKKFFAKIGWGCEFSLKQSVRLYEEGLLSLGADLYLYCPKLVGGTSEEFLRALWQHGEKTEAVIKAGLLLSDEEVLCLNSDIMEQFLFQNKPSDELMRRLINHSRMYNLIRSLLARYGKEVLSLPYCSRVEEMRHAIADGLEMHGQLCALTQKNLQAWEVYCSKQNIFPEVQALMDVETYSIFHEAGNTLDRVAKIKLLNSGNYELAEMIVGYEDMTEMWEYISHDPKLVAMF